jgi:hypothetical protein
MTIDIVTTLADSGPGSLCATLADAQPGDTITFAAALAGNTAIGGNGVSSECLGEVRLRRAADGATLRGAATVALASETGRPPFCRGM